MKRKHLLLILCAMFALCIIPFIITACSEKEEAFGDWVIVTYPTCETAGLEKRTSLTSPDVQQIREIPATGHEWNEWEIASEPSCLIAGVKTRTCNNCENLDMSEIPALGHSWSKWETILEADCEDRGTQIRTCTNDEGHTEYKDIPATGHDFSDWVVTCSPTCTTDGVETRYCRNCNSHTEVRAIQAYGHNWSNFVISKHATCTESGEGMYVCSNDSSHIITNTISATGHHYSDWVVYVPATENEDGEDIRICCHDSSHTETRIAPAKGSDGLEYTLNSAGTEYNVKRTYPYPTGTVYIPAVHNGLPVTSLASSAFQGCENLEQVVFIGNNLKTVGSLAFANCDKLQSIEFPEGVTTIYANAIWKCENLKSISLPSTLAYVGMNYGDHGNYIHFITSCPIFESITVAEGNTTYKVENGCLIDKTTNALITGTIDAVIPNYITEIKRGAFYGSGIESVCIPASVTNIGVSAFDGCLKLKEVTFENGKLKSLGASLYSIFGNCISLEKIELPENLIGIYGYAFKNCTSLKEVVFGNNLQIIAANAFNNCDAIEICEIPASVTEIYGNSFTGTAVSALTIAEGNTTYIKDQNCIIEIETNTVIAGGDNAVIPSYVTHIGVNAFVGRNLESVIIPNSVQSIGRNAFRECTSLKSVSFEMGSQLETIGEYAFENCKSITSILLPEKLKEISSSAFYNCRALSSVTFGFSDGTLVYGASSLESIGTYAFAWTALKSFEIPSTVTSIGQNAFAHCEHLTSLKVKDGNETYKMEGGCLIEIETGTVLFALDEAIVPENTKRI